MPISAANRKRYPKDWQIIRAAILERAERRCEFCGVPDGALIVRDHGPAGATFTLVNTGAVHDATTGEHLGYAGKHKYIGRKLTRVILTTAHLDHTPEHNDPANLRALCCRCIFCGMPNITARTPSVTAALIKPGAICLIG